MTGKIIRLQKLFNGNLKKENIIISAIDHGMFQGVQPGLENVREALEASMTADAILMGPGMIEHYGDFFYNKNSPTIISRSGFTTSYCFPWEYHEGHSEYMFSPAFLQSLGVEIIVSSLQLKTNSQQIDAKNAEIWGRLVTEKERLGIPLMGEFHPAVYEGIDKDEWHELIKSGCRILAELGADLIKTFYTDKRFEEITVAVPVPIVVLGSKKLPSETDALALAENALNGGARGVAFGRNIFQASNPKKMIRALAAVLKEGRKAKEASEFLR